MTPDLDENVGTLAGWLADVANRSCTITVIDRVIQVRGIRATDLDRQHVNRHRHALETAAAGTHPTWWNHVLGRTDHLSIDDMPTVPDPRDQLDGHGWPCACCGHPADTVTPDGLPWCQEHA